MMLLALQTALLGIWNLLRCQEISKFEVTSLLEDKLSCLHPIIVLDQILQFRMPIS